MANAVLTRDSGTGLVDLEELRKVPCPAPEGRWKPVPHAEVVRLVLAEASDRGLDVPADGMRLSASRDGMRMFGVALVEKGLGIRDDEYGFAIGFRNSHDKSLSLRIVLGANVFVCDNLMMNVRGPGAFDERKLHTVHMEPAALVSRAFDALDDAAVALAGRYDRMRETLVPLARGNELLVDAVAIGALPKSRLYDACLAWRGAADEDPSAEVDHPETAWALQQAVTAQWKRTVMTGLEHRSLLLNELFDERVLGKSA